MKNTFKTLLILFAVASLTFTACKKETDIDQGTGKDHLNPPSWIQFIWTKANGLNGEDGYQFTSDDMITVMYDQNGNQTSNLSLKDAIKDKDYTISEQHTTTSYQFSIHYNDTNSTENYQFVLSGPQLIYTDNVQNTFTYTKRN